MSVLGKTAEQMGSGGREWRTVLEERRVLAVAHTVPYAKRLLDVLALLGNDLRIQVATTAPPHVFGDGVRRFLDRAGSVRLPWEDARAAAFDLALAAGPTGVAELTAPLITMPHGASYLKRITAPAESGVAGLRRQDVMPDGRTLPAALVLPHHEDRAELARDCPEALAVARVVGDPGYDRIAASLPLRGRYRRALGISNGQKLVVVASTWGPRSNFSGLPALLARVSRELPPERYRVAVLVHPNVWYGHGRWQVNAWLASRRRHGIVLVPPPADWRPVLVAADAIIGDHGSVTLYGTLTGKPILLAGSPGRELNPASPAAELAKVAPKVSPGRSLRGQLAYAVKEYRPERYAPIAARITSEPGRFGRNMRALLYGQLGLSEPAYPVRTVPLPEPPRLDAWVAEAGGRPW